MSIEHSNTCIYLWALLFTVCFTLPLLFAVAAQLSATKKLQGERGLQTNYSGRYLSTSGSQLLLSPSPWLCTLAKMFFVCFSPLLGIMKNENGVPEDEENFEEAIKNVNTALNPTKVPDLPFSLVFKSHYQLLKPLAVCCSSCNVSYFCRFRAQLKTSSIASSVTTSQHRFLFYLFISSSQ